jgi:hypothetical protein
VDAKSFTVHCKSNGAGLGLKCYLTHASHSTCISSPEAYLSFYESDDTYQKMEQDVINMPHVKQYKSSVKRILHFMSQITLESRTIFTVYVVRVAVTSTCRQNLDASSWTGHS